MDDQPEVIRQQMEETRTSLSEKLEALENQVVGTVQETVGAVTETVETVKETVQETVGAVKETVQDTVTTVRDALDIELQVRRRPWLMFGGSIAVGYLAGALIGRRPQYRPRATPFYGPSRMTEAPRESNGAAAHAEPQPSFLSKVAEAIGPELGKLKGVAIGTLMGTVRDAVVRSLPPETGTRLREVMDDVTKKLGGEPVSPVCRPEPATGAYGRGEYEAADVIG